MANKKEYDGNKAEEAHVRTLRKLVPCLQTEGQVRAWNSYMEKMTPVVNAYNRVIYAQIRPVLYAKNYLIALKNVPNVYINGTLGAIFSAKHYVSGNLDILRDYARVARQEPNMQSIADDLDKLVKEGEFILKRWDYL